MKKFISLVLLVVVMVYADEPNGFYMGWQVGGSSLATPTIANQTGQSNLTDSSTSSVTWGMKLGYQKEYAKKKHLGFEVAYNDDGYGTIAYGSGNNYQITSTDVDFLLTFQYDFDEKFYLTGKVGYSYLRQKYSIRNIARNSGFDPITSSDDWKPVISIDLGYNITRRVSIYVNYKHIFASDLTNTDDAFIATSLTVGSNESVYNDTAISNTVSLGLRYNF